MTKGPRATRFRDSRRRQPSLGTERAGVARGLRDAYMNQRHRKVRHETRRANASRFASRYSIAVIVLRAIRVRAVISFLRAIASAVSSQCFRSYYL